MAGRSRLRSRARVSSAAAFFAGASLDMNFAASAYSGKTPADLTVSRTGTTGYAETSEGTLTSFAINTARITNKGLLVEETRTNLILQSQTFQTSWTIGMGSTSADAIAAPNGTLTADLFTEDGASGAHGYTQTVAAASNVAYVVSLYVKPNGRTWVRLFVDDAGGTNFCDCYFNCSGSGTVGTATNSGTGASAAGTIQALANGWYRCVLTGTPASVSTGSVRMTFRTTTADATASYAGNGTSGAYFWGAQLEAGVFATSYIPTTTGSQARGADIVSLQGAAFSDWYTSSTTGTLYVEWLLNGSNASGTVKYAATICDNTANNRATIITSAAGTSVGFRLTAAASLTFTVDSAGVAGNGNVQKAVMAWDSAGTGNAAKQGSTVGADDATVTAPVSPNRMYLGTTEGGTTQQTNGFIRRVSFAPSRIANATLQTMTA